MNRLLLALALFCSLPVAPAWAGLITVLDLSAVIQRPADLGLQEDGTIVVGGQTTEPNLEDTSGQLIFVASDLSGFATQRTGSINGAANLVPALSNDGRIFGISDINVRAGRGETSNPSSIEDLGALGNNFSRVYAFDNNGTAYGSTGGGVLPYYVTVGGTIQPMANGVAGAITGTTDSGSLQIGLGVDVNSNSNFHPGLWTTTAFLGFLPGYNGETDYYANPKISPDGSMIATYRVQVDFDPDTFEITETPYAIYYVDTDGIVQANQTAADYTRVEILDANGDPFVGVTRAATNLAGGWIAGHTNGLPEFGETNNEAWIMNLGWDSPRLAKDWLLDDFGIILPHDPTTVRDLLITPDGDLLALFEGSTMLVSIPLSAIPEPSAWALMAFAAAGVVVVQMRRRMNFQKRVL